MVIIGSAEFLDPNSWTARYQRNNKCGGFKNIRCFPRCSTPHRNKAFCGSSLTLKVKRCESTNDATTKLDNNKELCAWGAFRPIDESEFYMLGQTIDLRYISSEEQNSHDPARRWFCGYRVDGTIDTSTVLFEFNKRKKGWNYGWVASKHTIEVPHIFEVYIFAPYSPEQRNVYRVVGIAQSPSFVLYSRKCPSSQPPTPLAQTFKTVANAKHQGAVMHGSMHPHLITGFHPSQYEILNATASIRKRQRAISTEIPYTQRHVRQREFQQDTTQSCLSNDFAATRNMCQLASKFAGSNAVSFEKQIDAHLQVVLLTIERLESCWRMEQDVNATSNLLPNSSSFAAATSNSVIDEMTKAMMKDILMLKDTNEDQTPVDSRLEDTLTFPEPDGEQIEYDAKEKIPNDRNYAPLFPGMDDLKVSTCLFTWDKDNESETATYKRHNNEQIKWERHEHVVQPFPLATQSSDEWTDTISPCCVSQYENHLPNQKRVVDEFNSTSNTAPFNSSTTSTSSDTFDSDEFHRKVAFDLATFAVEEKGLTKALSEYLAECPKGTSRAAVVERKLAVVKALEGHIGGFLRNYGIEYADFANWLATWKGAPMDWQECEQRADQRFRALNNFLVQYDELQEFQEQVNCEFHQSTEVPRSLGELRPKCNLTGIWKCDEQLIRAFESVRLIRGIPWVVRKMLRFIEKEVEVRHSPGKILIRAGRKLLSGEYVCYQLDGKCHPWPMAPPFPFTGPLAVSSRAWMEDDRVVTIHNYNATQRSIRYFRRETQNTMKVRVCFQERLEDEFSLSFGPWSNVLHSSGYATLCDSSKNK